MAIPPPKSGMPVGTHCPRCDYNISGSPFGRCPECGCTLTLEDIAYDAATSRTYIRTTRRQLPRLLTWYGLFVAAWMATSVARTNQPSNALLVFGIAMAPAAVCWCAAHGWWFIRPKRLRRLHAAVWMRFAWLMFVPWIVPLMATWVYLFYRTGFEEIVWSVIVLLGCVGFLCPLIFMGVLDAKLAGWRRDQDISVIIKLTSALVAMAIVYGGAIVVAATTGVFG